MLIVQVHIESFFFYLNRTRSRFHPCSLLVFRCRTPWQRRSGNSIFWWMTSTWTSTHQQWCWRSTRMWVSTHAVSRRFAGPAATGPNNIPQPQYTVTYYLLQNVYRSFLLLRWIMFSKISKHYVVRSDLVPIAGMEVLLQEDTGCGMPGSASYGGSFSVND